MEPMPEPPSEERKILKGLVKVFLLLGVVILSWALNNQVTVRDLADFLNYGRISDDPKTFPYAFQLRPDADKKVVDNIAARMMTHTKDHMYTAIEMGVNLALAWFPALDVFVINPRILSTSGELIHCDVHIGPITCVEDWPRHATVRFVDRDWDKHTFVFKDKYACLIQCFMR